MINIIIFSIAITLFYLMLMILTFKETKQTKTQKQITTISRIK
jgi:hypothetical protein